MSAELKLKNKEDYARVVCMFLAEGLRSRNITLVRGAEIAQKVYDNLNLLDSEQDFLRLIKELSNDFEELLQLEQRVNMYVASDQRAKMEKLVKEFVAAAMVSDSKTALDLIHEATKPDSTIESLKKTFPKFQEYLETNHGAITKPNARV